MMDREHDRNFKEWLSSLSPVDRDRLRSQGITSGDVGRVVHKREGDELAIELSSVPVAYAVESEKESGGAPSIELVLSALRMALSNIINPRPGLTSSHEADIVGLAIGMPGLGGMSEVGKCHGVSRQAVSKKVIQYAKESGLPPSIYMRSEDARDACRLNNTRKRRATDGSN